MAEIAKYRVDGGVGCGFMGGIFRRWNNWPRKTSVHSLPAESSNDEKKAPDTDISKRQRSGNCEKPARNSALGHPRPSISHRKVKGQRPSDAARTSTSSSPTSGPDYGDERKTKTEHAGKSTELSKTTADPLKSSEGKAFVRVTSSDIMLSGHLGNLRQTGPGKSLERASPHSSAKTLDYLSKSLQRKSSVHSRNANMGNIIRKNSDESRQLQGLGNQLDPEVFKSLGNKAFKQGRYQEALTLYDRAIALDSKKSTYRSNKSAALIGLGRLMEAIFECKEAIRIEPSYQRAHHRLAKLYIRMGDAENANYHLKRSGAYADSEDMAQAQAVQKHLGGCNESRKSKAWNTLLKDTHRAISSGADSAPQVYALQAEALLNLYRHEEAYATYQKGPNFSNDFCTKLLGRAGSGYLAMIEARVLLAAGRFEDAVAASQRAARLDPSNKEVNAVVKKTKAVSSARLRGNMLFKASKFSEACVMYNEGLENDPYNSVLLCNRAAGRSKLGQFEKAVEDCTAALNLRPSYSKARLRRADCNSKLERWEASVQDYEMLIRQTEALKLLQKAMKILEDKPGNQSTIAGIEARMGVMFYAVGRYEEARNSFESAIAKLRASGERKSPFFGVVLNQMGLACVQLFKIDEAAELFEEARGILEQECGTCHQDTLGVYSNLAATYDAMGRVEDAIEILENVLKLREEKLGIANPDFEDEKRRLAELLKEAGRTRDRKAKSLENLIDPSSKKKKEVTKRWPNLGFRI